MIGIVIAGPTAVGKTALSVELAICLDAVIINCDSMQVYKYLDIGTAKIKEEEKNGVPHYMLDLVEPTDKYSVGEFQKEVDKLLAKFEKENKNVILVGGTGLYINAITEGLSVLPSADETIRKTFENQTNEELFEKLKELDPESSELIHANNRIRVERALEVCLITGEKFSALNKKNIKGNNYNFLKVALGRDREVIYSRVNNRVNQMFDNGLLEEAKWLYENYKEGISRIKAIGYKECFEYFDGKITLEECKYYIQKETRKYVKRQFTWFNADENYKWFNLDQMYEKAVINEILNLVKII